MKTIKQSCQFCELEFDAPIKEVRRGNGRFCSRSCGAKGKRRKRLEPNVVCAMCSKPFYKNESKRKLSKSGLYFCSRACKDQAQRLGGIKEIQPPHYGSGNNYRHVAFRHHPHKCNRCGYDQRSELLQVHHKDRDRTNNKPENLEILCPTCHAADHYDNRDGLYNRLAT